MKTGKDGLHEHYLVYNFCDLFVIAMYNVLLDIDSLFTLRMTEISMESESEAEMDCGPSVDSELARLAAEIKSFSAEM